MPLAACSDHGLETAWQLEGRLMALVLQQSISVVFPVYNEEANIATVVEQAISFLEFLTRDWEVILVNDGSQDRTGAIIIELAKGNSRLVTVHHESNHGYGAALKSGIQKASKELIFFCDSDLQFHTSELLLLLMWIEQYDIVIGYRAKRRDALHRRINAIGWKVLVRLLLGLRVRDIDCGFKLFRNVVFNAVQIDAVGAMVNTDILVQASKMGFRIKEVPVTHFARLQGTQTGANIKVIVKAFKELVRLYHKLRKVHPIVFEYKPHQASKLVPVGMFRYGRRRNVDLPINFPDRRRRLILANGTVIPLSSSSDSNRVTYGK
jgi:glycosyltransferase involved in cell wall biosynthesis